MLAVRHKANTNTQFMQCQVINVIAVRKFYNGALAGKGLELAYSDSMMDNFLLGVQGSGYVDTAMEI